MFVLRYLSLRQLISSYRLENQHMKLLRIKKTIPDLLRLVVSSTLLILASSAWADETPSDAITRFDIVRFEVEGNTLLPQQAAQDALVPFTGKARDFSDVQHA